MKSLKVLLVEDEPSVYAAMELVIEMLGHAAQGCQGHDSCKAQLQAHDFDLMILDLNLGTSSDDGVKLVQDIRRLGMHLPPTVILSAQPPNELAAAALAIGTKSYLRKPCTSKELSAAIMSAMQAHAG